MITKALKLLKNPNFVLKIIELILVLVGFVFVILQDQFLWPNSVTMILSMDTGTYSIILSVISLAYVLEEPHRMMELSFTIIGVGVFVIGGTLSFWNYSKAKNTDEEESKIDLYLGIVLSGTSLAMAIDTFLNARQMRTTIRHEI